MNDTNDILTHIENTYGNDEYIQSLRNISISSKDGEPLVNSKQLAYNFDKIKEELFSGKGVSLSSIDALLVSNNSLYFIEFKKGFKDIRNRDEMMKKNFPCLDGNVLSGNCKNVRRLMNDYCNIFEKFRMKEKKELVDNVRLKMLETLKILESHILPNCNGGCNCEIKMILVVDRDSLTGDPTKDLSTIGKNLSKSQEKQAVSIISHLQKYGKECIHNKKGLYYSEISVYESTDFEKKFLALI